jgi:hypothetical protein
LHNIKIINLNSKVLNLHIKTNKDATKDQLRAVKGKRVIPVTCCGGPQGCETLRLPHFL